MNEKRREFLDFKHKDAASYDAVTDDFDRFTERFTGTIAARVVDLARLSPGDRVLDVGSGTGVVTFMAATRATAAGNVLGIDLSDGMLKKARDKSVQRGTDAGIAFLKMDAEALAFPDAAFDCVLSLYALRHFPRPELALAEMRRVLRPGGRLVVAIGGPPRLLSREAMAAVYRRVGNIARRLRGKRDLFACAYLNELVERHLPTGRSDEEAQWTKDVHVQSSVPRMMRSAGFRGIHVTWTGHAGMVGTKEEFWDVQITFSSIARKRLAAASADAVERIRREFDAGCTRALEAGGRLLYPMGALIVSGTSKD